MNVNLNPTVDVDLDGPVRCSNVHSIRRPPRTPRDVHGDVHVHVEVNV